MVLSSSDTLEWWHITILQNRSKIDVIEMNEYKIKACCLICEHCVYTSELCAACAYHSECIGLVEVEQSDCCNHFAINPDVDAEVI